MTRLYRISLTLLVLLLALAGTISTAQAVIAPTQPGTPTLAAGSVSPNTGEFSLTWTVSTDADGDPITYTLEHKDADDAGYSVVATGITSNSYAFTAPEAEGTWTYRVQASDGSLTSAYSADSAAIKVDQSAPTAPTAGFTPAAAYNDGTVDWYKDSVTVSYAGSTDPNLADGSAGSGVASYSADQTFSTTGAHSYSGTATDNVGNVSAATAGTVNVDASSPVVTCGVPDGQWHATDVSISCTATDTGSDLLDPNDASFTLTTSVTAGTETDNASTDSRTVCDNVGHCVTAGPISGNMIDKKTPTTSCGTADGIWHASDVTIACTASDGGSGLATAGDASFGLTTNVPAGTEDANAFTNSRDVCDAVGNCATAGPIGGNMVDKKSPDTTCGTADGLWHAENISIACGASDGGSGLASDADASFALWTNVPAGTETADASTASHSVCDGVNNCTTAGPIDGNMIDRKAPVLTLPEDIVVNATSPDGAVVTYAVSADDGGSGLETLDCTPPSGSLFPVGATTVTCTATDAVANSSIEGFSITVLGAADQLTQLRADTIKLVANTSTELVLVSIVDRASWYVNAGHTLSATTTLKSYIALVSIYEITGQISPAVADQLEAGARQVIDALR